MHWNIFNMPDVVWFLKINILLHNLLYLVTKNVTQYNKRYILSAFEKKMRFFHYLTEDLTSFPMIKFIKIEVILLKVQLFQSVPFPFILFLFCKLFCSLSQNKLGRQDVPFVVLGHICREISTNIPRIIEEFFWINMRNSENKLILNNI